MSSSRLCIRLRPTSRPSSAQVDCRVNSRLFLDPLAGDWAIFTLCPDSFLLMMGALAARLLTLLVLLP